MNGGKDSRSGGNLTITGTAEETYESTRVALSSFLVHAKMICGMLGYSWDDLSKVVRHKDAHYYIDMGKQTLRKLGHSVRIDETHHDLIRFATLPSYAID